MRKQASVLGGYRPKVRDDGRDAFNRVQYLRAMVRNAMEKLQALEEQLYAAESEREDMRAECNHCDDCSACIG